MFNRIVSALGAVGFAIAIVNVAPVAWAANRLDAGLVIMAASATVLRMVINAVEGEKSE